MGPKEIKIESSTPGYAHTKLAGSCGPEVTVADIEARFGNPFGCRGAWVRDGKFGVVRHDD